MREGLKVFFQEFFTWATIRVVKRAFKRLQNRPTRVSTRVTVRVTKGVPIRGTLRFSTGATIDAPNSA